jgi:hypothetical protein
MVSRPGRGPQEHEAGPVEPILMFQCPDAPDPAYVRPDLLDVAPNGNSAPNRNTRGHRKSVNITREILTYLEAIKNLGGEAVIASRKI